MSRLLPYAVIGLDPFANGATVLVGLLIAGCVLCLALVARDIDRALTIRRRLRLPR